jgi:hypothetical protein
MKYSNYTFEVTGSFVFCPHDKCYNLIHCRFSSAHGKRGTKIFDPSYEKEKTKDGFRITCHSATKVSNEKRPVQSPHSDTDVRQS